MLNRILLGLICFASSTLAGAQKYTLDTLYFDQQGNALEKTEDYTTWAIVKRDRQNRYEGYLAKYDKEDRLVEVTDYRKGKRDGAYYLFSQDGSMRVVGFHNDEKKVGIWAEYKSKDKFSYIFDFGDGDRNPKPIVFDDEVQDPYMPLGGENKNPFKLDSLVLDAIPNFYGGPTGFGYFIEKNLKRLTPNERNRLSGFVIVEFTILKSGHLVAPNVLYSTNETCTRQTLNILSKSPLWQPALKNGKKVDSIHRERIAY